MRVGRGDDKSGRTIVLISADHSTIKSTKKDPATGRMTLQTYKEFVLRATDNSEREEWFAALTDELEQGASPYN